MEVNPRSNEFQREYIEYLKERNTELLDRLNKMKETYENKILSKDLSKHYLTSVLENVLNICTVFPQEIDSFFDKMTAAMSALKNILLRKSEMEQLVDKILKAMTPENFTELLTISGSSLMQEENLNERATKKTETVKVSPMIDGHIISTEPKIYLSRVSEIYSSLQRNEAHQLSPIIEASPDSSSEELHLEGHVFKNLKIPLERINCNKFSNNYINEESPRNRFKGPKTWKKSLFSNKCESNDKSSVFMENSENLSKKLSEGEAEMSQLPQDLNPLEGPSWLYQDNSEINSSCHSFVDYKRRKHRFAIMFDSNEDCVSYFEENKKLLKKNSNKFSENHEESNDKEDNFGSIGKKTRASSEDLFNDSHVSEDGESNTPLKKNRSSKRWSNRRSSKKDDITDFHEDIKNKTLNSNKKKKRSSLKTLVNSDSCDEGDNQENSDRNFRNGVKSYKSLLGMSNVFVKLEDCMATMETLRESTNTGSPSLKRRCIKSSKSKSQTKKRLGFSPDTEGRKKRKAAPSFKLTEPRLNSKLRRN